MVTHGHPVLPDLGQLQASGCQVAATLEASEAGSSLPQGQRRPSCPLCSLSLAVLSALVGPRGLV